MRIAVCVSGICKTKNPKGSLINNHNILKSKFPTADFFFATWDTYRSEFENTFNDTKCHYFTEPLISYHPYTDIPADKHISTFYQKTVDWVKKGGQERLNWTSHHTKQILIHTWLIDKIKSQYDVIVRARFDGFISKNANFENYLGDTFKMNRANCFGATKKELFDKLNEFDTKPGTMHHEWMLDQLIIHPARAIDTDYVTDLHNQKILHAAEYGWYQVISMPYGSNHRNHDGWVNHDCNVLDKFLYQIDN